MITAPSSVVNKAALGELTLGEVWDLIGEKVQMIVVADNEFRWGPFQNIALTPRVKLEVFEFSFEEREGSVDPEYSFDLNSKVKVKKDHVEIVHVNHFGEREMLALYFLFRPDPEMIKMDFLLPGG